jgi:hypothetical protein
MSIKNFFTNLTILVASVLTMSGCDAIYDNEGECSATYLVRFRYDMNMKYANAFAHEVNAVHLYVVDKDGNVVWDKADYGEELNDDNYTMQVNVGPGKYTLLAWCSLNQADSYSFSNDNTPFSADRSRVSKIDNLGCVMNGITTLATNPQTVITHDLDNLYHGMLTNVDFTAETGEHVVTVPLIKDTNRVRVVLQHVSGAPLDADQFTFEITADNAVLAYDNSVVPDNGVIYYPWHTEAATTGNAAGEAMPADAGNTSANTMVNVAVAELTVSRLVVEDSPRLTVTNNDTGETVFSIPIKDYALMVKGYENNSMPDQEYLDRQDEYNMTFFLDERDRWVDSYIYINSWKIVLQNSSL